MNEERITVFSSEDYAKSCEAIKNSQEKVFISGSISMKWLEEKYIQYLENIVSRNHTVLIGDAYGVDKAVQQYFAKHNYQKVIVYFSGEKVRNNIGNRQTKQISNPENLTGKARYQLKDKAMADDCDFGIMFWDGKSKGTKHNMDYLDKLSKDYFVENEKASSPEEIKLSDAEYKELDEICLLFRLAF
jgi:hypothetical protein